MLVGPTRSGDQGASRQEESCGATGHGNPYLARVLGEAALAIGRSILVIVWHLLSDPQARFHDLGPDFYDTRLGPDRKKRSHVRQLEALGYKVTLELAA